MFFNTDIAVSSVHVYLEIIWTETEGQRRQEKEGGEDRRKREEKTGERGGRRQEKEGGEDRRKRGEKTGEKKVKKQIQQLISQEAGRTHHRFMIVVY